MPLRTLTSETTASWYEAGTWTRQTLAQVVDERAAEAPDRLAVADQHEQLTYRELVERSAGLAAWLIGQGLQPGEVVALQSSNRIAIPLLHLACSRADLLFASLSDAWRERELTHLLATSEAAMVILPPAGKAVDHLEMIASLRPDLPALRHVGGFDGAGGDFDLADVSPRSTDLRPRPRDTEDARFVMVSSGTTEVPRMSLWTDGNLWSFMQSYIDATQMGTADVALGLAPANTGSTGYVFPVLAPLLVGASSVLLEHWSPVAALDLVEELRPTRLTAIPTQLIKILQQDDIASRDLSSLQVVTNAGASMPPDQAMEVERVFGVTIQAVYGATDGGVPVMIRVDDPPEKRYRSVGQVLPHGELRLVDANLEDVVPGAVGEIAWRSPTKHLGYFNEPERTDAAFHEDGWYRSGDLGEVDDAGYLSIVGRVKDLIIRGGQNISPREVEELVGAHPSVSVVSVVGLPDPVYGERTCACVELKRGASLDLAELVDFLKQRNVAVFKLPERLEVFEDLPKSAGGKISKVDVREQVLARAAG